MGFHGRNVKPVKRLARFVKGDLPDWIEESGTLMRAITRIGKWNGTSQIPGYITVSPRQWASPTEKLIAVPGDFGLYLGKKHVLQKIAGGRELNVPVPTFWFNGFRIVFTTLSSYDDVIVSDVVYDDWLSQHSA